MRINSHAPGKLRSLKKDFLLQILFWILVLKDLKYTFQLSTALSPLVIVIDGTLSPQRYVLMSQPPMPQLR